MTHSFRFSSFAFTVVTFEYVMMVDLMWLATFITLLIVGRWLVGREEEASGHVYTSAVIMLAAAVWLQGVFNPFAIPAVCSRTGVECGPNGAVGFTITADDLPTGAVTAWKQVESETGIPWFYAAAWEKVLTDFGRADLTKERGNEGAKEPPPELIDLARQSLKSGVTTTASAKKMIPGRNQAQSMSTNPRRPEIPPPRRRRS